MLKKHKLKKGLSFHGTIPESRRMCEIAKQYVCSSKRKYTYVDSKIADHKTREERFGNFRRALVTRVVIVIVRLARRRRLRLPAPARGSGSIPAMIVVDLVNTITTKCLDIPAPRGWPRLRVYVVLAYARQRGRRPSFTTVLGELTRA